jgi:hypothetical protein
MSWALAPPRTGPPTRQSTASRSWAAAGHIVGHHGVRVPLASAFAIATVGMALLTHVSADGTYLRNVLPGMLVAGFGLGIAVVSVSIAILTGARETEMPVH